MTLLIDLIKVALFLAVAGVVAFIVYFLVGIFLYFLPVLIGFVFVIFIGYAIFCAFRDYEH